MSEIKNDGGRAFPSGVTAWDDTFVASGDIEHGSFGMSLRDWFAGQALSNYAMEYPSEEAAKLAYADADAMLAERRKMTPLVEADAPAVKELWDATLLKQVWNQQSVPVVLRRGQGRQLRIRLPYREGNFYRLSPARKRRAVWDDEGRYWELPPSRFDDVVNMALRLWGSVYVIQPHRPQDKCAPACWNAVGHYCECSCMGEHHGAGHPGNGWFVVSDTFAARWWDQELACRLLTLKDGE